MSPIFAKVNSLASQLNKSQTDKYWFDLIQEKINQMYSRKNKRSMEISSPTISIYMEFKLS